MDYIKVRKWLRFYEREGVNAVDAVSLIAFWISRLENPPCYDEGVCSYGLGVITSEVDAK